MAITIGVGGLIGSGKSVVCQGLKELNGWFYLDSDSKAKQLYYSEEVRHKLKEKLNLDPIDGKGQIDKTTLTEVLKEPDQKAVLEGIIHGSLFKYVTQLQSSLNTGNRRSILIIESAILFTSGLAKLCDYTVAVTAPREVRMERSLKRDAGKGSGYFEQMDISQTKEQQLLKDANFEVKNYSPHAIIPQLENITVLLNK